MLTSIDFIGRYRLRHPVVVVLLFWTQLAVAATSVSQHGITWHFDGDYSVGQYVNGDWWVLGPVTIVEITPRSTEAAGWTRNGTQLNPKVSGTQGFDSSIEHMVYSPELNVAPSATGRPLQVVTGSVVSTISQPTPNNRPQVKVAAILTVTDQVPAPRAFRPSPVGTDKRSPGSADRMRSGVLRSLPLVSTTPDPERVAAFFAKPWIEFNTGWIGRYIHPSENQPDYGREMANQLGMGLLLLHLDIPPETKQKLLVRIVQYGIDVFGTARAGGVWRDDGGHNHGRKLPLLLAGLLLNDDEMLRLADGAKHHIFAEDRQTWYVTESDVGRNLYQGDGRPRDPYRIEDVGLAEWGEKHTQDPARDGRNWDAYYRNIVGSSVFGHVLAARLTPGAVDIWNWSPLFDYIDRFWSNEEGKIGNGTNTISEFEGAMWRSYRYLGYPEANVPKPPRLIAPQG